MAEIQPFRGVVYNKNKVTDLAKVVCPPYDVISEDQQNAFYKEHEKNFIRISLGKQQEKDDENNNKYTRAKTFFEQWLQEGVLKQEEVPAIYFYRQEYRVLGEKHSRIGFLCLMKIEDDKNSKIFPHENTHAAAKEDRFKLWKTLSANCSPIFVCFSDKEKKVDKIFTKHVSLTPPFMDIVTQDDVRHIVWRLTGTEYINEMVESLRDQQLFIADGHHRFEVSRQLRQWYLSKNKNLNGKEPYNYVLTYFTNMDSRDLKIFPMHRIVKSIPDNIRFMSFIAEFFRIDKLKFKGDLAVLLAKAGRQEHAFGLYTKNDIMLLRLKNKALIEKYVTEGSPMYKRLDATILKYFVFDRVGIKSEDIMYTHDVNEAIGKVDTNEAEAAFIMNPVTIQQLKDIALNGERMPPKTTYFYPKVLSGITIYKMSNT